MRSEPIGCARSRSDTLAAGRMRSQPVGCARSRTVLLAVVDAKYNFLIVDVGSYGKNSDGGILQNSKFGKKLNTNKLKLPPNKPLPNTTESLPHVFIGDEAFPLSNNILRPYPREQTRTDLSKSI
ncbi:hypothetical protein HF086_006465 [Spodoptera exigua]|uniref:DDE Tnp4 domain-containing protein n=1 Tax=Spodoptera exigua TaxID=7107 RepID=A0A922SSB4_SPOEX|nr:hypothetical protein HF086_006465 [Spodoptera exigua]